MDAEAVEPIPKKARDQWEWEEEPRAFKSNLLAVFPEPNYTRFKEMSPSDLFTELFDDGIMSVMAEKSNEYGMSKFGLTANITSEDIQAFLCILLLSGYNHVTDYKMYWSNSLDTENLMVKKAISRDRFLLIKRCFHLGVPVNRQPADGDTPDRYKKVRVLVDHLQAKFGELYVPEQCLSHDEAMIKYFGKCGLKQSMRNKPIRFGFKVWVLATVSGFVVSFDLYQGKGLGLHTTENVKAVGAAGASVLDVLDLMPEGKRKLPYHIFADNFFSSQKLIDVLLEKNYQYTGTIRQDRVKGKPPLTSVDKFKKMARGYHETVVLKDQSQIITRWNDNAPVTMISSILGDQPMRTASRYLRTAKNYTDIPQPHIVHQYNNYMGGVDRFDQNNNHIRVTIGGKKWYWSVVTWLLDTAVQNAWQLHKKAGGSMSLLAFKREVVCTTLRSVGTNRSRHSSGSSGRIGQRPGDADLRYDRLSHFVEKRTLRRECAMEGCKVKVATYCDKCDRAVCINHFKAYHILG